jgi:beta-glucosidase/6-phospho-beta-glucosidase/beta-galactosidase
MIVVVMRRRHNLILALLFCFVGGLWQPPIALAGKLPVRFQASTPRELQHSHFLDWAQAKEQEIKNKPEPISESDQFNEPVYLSLPSQEIKQPTSLEKKRIQASTELYFKNFGRNFVESFLWTGIESGNPLTRLEDYRWNSLREQGFYDSQNRKKFIQTLRQAGIRNIRLGMSNHEIDLKDDSTWAATTAMIDDFYQAGFKISLDLHHFGIEDQFRVLDFTGKTNGEKSYYLNPEWPSYFSLFARRAIEKYHQKIQAVTIMNEPETVVGFNGELWHGGFPGWQDPQSNRFYVQRSLQVAKASVLARLQIEDFLSHLRTKQKPRLLYIHTEASVHKLYWKDFNLYRRFVASDMILGHQWLIDANLQELARVPMEELDGRWHEKTDETRTNLDWVVENYLIYNQAPENREALRKDLVMRLQELQALHLELFHRFGKTMRTDSVLGVDYYAHNEDKDKDMKPVSPEPQYYPEQIKAGRRVGLYQILIEYSNRYQMPVMIAESGTPYYHYGARWTQQILLECAKAASEGVPFLGYALYPAVDTWGWETALSVPRDQAIYNPSGLVDLEYRPKAFIEHLRRSLQFKKPVQKNWVY